MDNYNINDLINDAKLALKSGAHFSALSLSFALVSECANVEYPDEWFDENADNDDYLKKHFSNKYNNGKYNKGNKNHDKERFVMWIDDQNNSHNCSPQMKEAMKKYEQQRSEFRKCDNDLLLPELNGELLYQLRCELSHKASSYIEFNNEKKISDEGNKRITNDGFILVLDDDKPFSKLPYITSEANAVSSKMKIGINKLILKLLRLVESYYNQNKEKKFNVICVLDNRKIKHKKNDL